MKTNRGQFVKGIIPWNKGRTNVYTPEVIEKMKKGLATGSYKGHPFYGGQSGWFKKGHKDLVPKEKRGHTQETKDKISLFQRRKNKNRIPNIIKRQEREWQRRVRSSYQWKDWRLSVFQRDNYTCRECGVLGTYLEPHHIIPIRDDKSKIFELTNGITLCRPCHIKTVCKESCFAEKYTALAAA